ncbi:MAG: acyl-CoA dehydrogenase, partial [Thermomicrobiales bacterium]
TPDGWVINGHKSWATLSPALDYAVVMLTAIDEHGEKSRGNLLVPMHLPRISVKDTWDNLGMRSTGSNDIVFENVLVPLKNLLPTPQTAPGNSAGPWGLVTSAVYLGIATAARDFAVNFAQHRIPSGLGKPIAELQTVQHRIAQIELLLLQSRSVLYGTVETWERFPEQRDAIAWQFAAAKYTVTNNAITITDQALRVVGSVGLQKQNPLERYFRDVRAGLGNPPMDDIALTIIGKTALGLS